jgi:hypothetical protein
MLHHKPLEEIVQEKHGLLKRAVGYILPLFDSYDSLSEATKLWTQDEEVRALGMRPKEIAGYLQRAAHDHHALWNAARLADTMDRFTSIPGMIAEGIGYLAGAAPGVASKVIEESVEMLFKAPFFYLTFKDPATKHDAWSMLMYEGATSATPVIGNAVETLLNMYMHNATRIITNYGRELLFNERAPGPHLPGKTATFF